MVACTLLFVAKRRTHCTFRYCDDISLSLVYLSCREQYPVAIVKSSAIPMSRTLNCVTLALFVAIALTATGVTAQYKFGASCMPGAKTNSSLCYSTSDVTNGACYTGVKCFLGFQFDTLLAKTCLRRNVSLLNAFISSHLIYTQ